MRKIVMLTKWEKHFIKEAEHWASMSKDPNTKIGAVIVKDRQVLSTGYNGIPRGVSDTVPERSSREGGEKYYWYEHGERNAIYNAARVGMRTIDATMYLNCGTPCADCARAIIQAGITMVYCKEDCATGQRDKWNEHAKRSRQMFAEADVVIKYYSKEK